jgi:tetratricopeptide (TPR) repeat protein
MQMIEPKEDGDETSGYRERLQIPGGKQMTMFVVMENGKSKLLDSSEKPNAIGLEILDRIAAKDLEGASVLLNWLRDEQHLTGGDDPLAGEVFPRFWTKGKQADAAQMKSTAAAILVQTKPTARKGIAILEDAKKTAASDIELSDINLALLVGYVNLEDYKNLLTVSSELAKQYPESKRAFLSECTALRALGRSLDADKLAQERLDRIPDDLDAMRALVFNAVAREDYRAAYERDKRVVDSGKAEPGDWNQMAWLTLFFQRAEGPDIDAAIRASQSSQNNPNFLHTLACLYAETGKTKEAREVLIQAMDLLDLDEPNPDYWYAFGRIAEQYGEREIAASDYAKVSKPKQALLIPQSSYRLAQVRLDTIQPAKTRAIENAADGQPAIGARLP